MFDWDRHNIEHIARHGVEPQEAEEAVLDPNRVPANAYRGPKGQPRQGMVGRTVHGRFLTVFVEKRAGMYRVVTARDAEETEKRFYRRKK